MAEADQTAAEPEQQQQLQEEIVMGERQLSLSLSLKKSSFRLRSPSLNSLRLRRVFDLFDKNGDGVLTVDEISQALILLGLDAEPSELHSIIASFVSPGHHGLTYPDFEALHKSLNVEFPDEQQQPPDQDQDDHLDSDLSEAFKVFDEDGDGYISAKELQVVLSKLGLDEAHQELDRIQLMISSFDHNHDGRVDFFEFKHMMLNAVVVPSS